jgi:hypothetical protein
VSDYSEFFLNSFSSVVQLDLLEISHSSFTQTFYLVRNKTDGVTVTHEDASEHEYAYVPMRVSLTGPRENLDVILSIQLGDLGEIVPAQLDAIREAGTFSELPVVIYRTYRSDDLTVPLYGPHRLQIKKFTNTREGAAFEARAPALNMNKTGENYKIARFPMLDGLL